MDTPSFPTQDNPLSLQTISEKGKAPKQRLASAAHAQDLFWTLHEAALPRLARAAVMQGNRDGNPPYNPAKMRNQAQAWRANFNTLEGGSRLEAAKVPFYDLFSSTPELASCPTQVDGEQVDAAAASGFRSECFDALLKSYPGFHTQFWTMLDDFVGFNKGFLWFPRPDSWHFKRLPWHKVFFPDGTSCDPDEWEVFAIQHSWPVHKLFGFVKDEEAARAAGWNVGQVWKAIRAAAPADIQNSYQDPMALQKAVRDSELYLSAKIGTVQAASIYVREFDGKWSRMMVQVERPADRKNASGGAQSLVERDSGPTPEEEEDAKLKSNDWLYNKPRVADDLHEIMCPFIFDVGDGSINEVSGLLKKIISMVQAKDRMVNSAVDNTFMRSQIVLQAQSGSGQAKSAVVQLGGGTVVVPPGYMVQPGTIFGDIEGSLAMTADLDNRLDRNTGIYRPAFEKPRGNPESATAASMRFSQSTVLTNSAVNRFYTQLDQFYQEIYRRAAVVRPLGSKDKGIKAAQEFQKKLREYGLTKEQIEDLQPGSVQAVRAIGNGSPTMRQQALAALGQLVPYMGPRGLENWKMDFAAAQTGQKGALRYFPKEDTAQVPTRDQWDAVQENADLNQGNQVVFADWQNHEEHAKAHLTAAFGAVQSVLQGGADPAIPFTFLQMALPHIGQHISKIPREGIRKELIAAYQEVAGGMKQVEQAAQKKMEQQGEAQSMSFEQQIAMQEAQHKAQLAEFKSQKMLELKAQRQSVEMQMNQQRAMQDGTLKDATTAADITRQTAAVQAQIELDRAKTQADIEAKRAAAAAKPKGSGNAQS